MNKNPLIVIFLTVFIDLIGFGIIIPLSPYLAQHYGADAFEVGILMACYSGFQFLFSPFWGRLSDRVGRRPILLISLLGAAFSHALFGWADTLMMLFVARCLAGLFGANISTAMAYIADVTPAQDRSKGMGLIGAAFGLGFILGPTLGGVLGAYGMSIPAYGAAAICFANFMFAYFVLPESLKDKTKLKSRVSRFASFKLHILRRDIGFLLIACLLLNLAMANMEAVLFLLVKDKFHLSMQTASYGFAYVGVMIAFTQGYLVRRLIPKYGEAKLLRFGSSLFALSLLSIAFAPSVWYLAVSMTGVALGLGTYSPALHGTVSLKTEKDKQGEVMGVVQSIAALARIFGPAYGGYLYAHFSQGAAFYTGSILAGLAFLTILVSQKQE